MPLADVGLRFSTGLVVGRWNIPNPQTRPEEFNRVASDIGFHVALAISEGAEGCFFINMSDEVEQN